MKPSLAQPMLSQATLTVIGTGLIGTSLALALREHVHRLYGVEANPQHREEAEPFFDAIYAVEAMPQALVDSHIVALAVPPRTIIQLLSTIGSLVSSGTLIFDLGSTKQQIVEAMNSLPEHVHAVAAHPMAGRETSGPNAASPILFQECRFIVCPTRHTTSASLDMMAHVIQLVGGKLMVMDAAEHDAAVATISHLPYLISAGLVGTVQQLAEADERLWRLAASGFRDTSRLAASDVTMMRDILFSNRTAVLHSLDEYEAQLAHLRALIESMDDLAFRATLERIRQSRRDWPNFLED